MSTLGDADERLLPPFSSIVQEAVRSGRKWVLFPPPALERIRNFFSQGHSQCIIEENSEATPVETLNKSVLKFKQETTLKTTVTWGVSNKANRLNLVHIVYQRVREGDSPRVSVISRLTSEAGFKGVWI